MTLRKDFRTRILAFGREHLIVVAGTEIGVDLWVS